MQPSYQLLSFNQLSLRQLYAVLQLRAEVFVVEQDCAYQDLDGLDFDALHLLQHHAGNFSGYTRLLAPGADFAEACAIGRVITAPSVRGTGLGKALMQESIRECTRLWPGSTVKLHAQVYLLEFYTQLGFTAYGDQFLEDGIPHQFMQRPASV